MVLPRRRHHSNNRLRCLAPIIAVVCGGILLFLALLSFLVPPPLDTDHLRSRHNYFVPVISLVISPFIYFWLSRLSGIFSHNMFWSFSSAVAARVRMEPWSLVFRLGYFLLRIYFFLYRHFSFSSLLSFFLLVGGSVLALFAFLFLHCRVAVEDRIMTCGVRDFRNSTMDAATRAISLEVCICLWTLSVIWLNAFLFWLNDALIWRCSPFLIRERDTRFRIFPFPVSDYWRIFFFY